MFHKMNSVTSSEEVVYHSCPSQLPLFFKKRLKRSKLEKSCAYGACSQDLELGFLEEGGKKMPLFSKIKNLAYLLVTLGLR
jgi:hypothetical protein